MAKHWNWCKGTRRDGKPCGRKVPATPSGVYIREYCHTHARRPR